MLATGIGGALVLRGEFLRFPFLIAFPVERGADCAQTRALLLPAAAESFVDLDQGKEFVEPGLRQAEVGG